MNVFPADQQVDAGDGQDDDKQDDCRRGGIGRIAAAVSVKHVVNITDDRIHARRIEVRSKERHSIAVGLEGSDP